MVRLLEKRFHDCFGTVKKAEIWRLKLLLLHLCQPLAVQILINRFCDVCTVDSLAKHFIFQGVVASDSFEFSRKRRFFSVMLRAEESKNVVKLGMIVKYLR